MKDEIRPLTGVRGVAALWVVVQHLTWGMGEGGDSLFYRFAYHGSAGVVIFMMLSGYILMHVYDGFAQSIKKESYYDYLVKRIARIYPLHFATLIATLLLFVMGRVGENDTFVTFFLSLLLMQSWGFVDPLSWNEPSWTVSVEFFCYLCFPLIALALGRLPRWIGGIALIGCSAFVGMGGYYHLLALLRVDGEHATLLANFSAMFVAGVALRRLAGDGRWVSPLLADLLVLVGSAVLSLTVLIHYSHAYVMIAAALIIVGLGRSAGWGRVLFGNRLAAFVGNISYTIYLTHLLTMIFIIRRLPQDLPVPVDIIIVVLPAAVVYFAFEGPARRYLRKIWGAHTKSGKGHVDAPPLAHSSEGRR